MTITNDNPPSWCHTGRLLYRAEPAWEEPEEVRTMLDSTSDLDAIPEDAVRRRSFLRT